MKRGTHTLRNGIIVLAVVLVVTGFVRGWFTMTGPHRENDGKKVEVNLTVDPDKIKADAEQVKESAEKLEEKVREEIRDATHGSDVQTPPSTPE
jgi:hypothetical protein